MCAATSVSLMLPVALFFNTEQFWEDTGCGVGANSNTPALRVPDMDSCFTDFTKLAF